MLDFKDLLNERQLEAVETKSQFTRIVAGAGSGKTRVLTFRIVYLISYCNIDPNRIIAITFTNKVANEMKDRVLALVPEAHRDLRISTFHSLCSRFLRSEIYNIDFPSNFTIFDDEDQEKLVKDIAVSLGYRRRDDIVKKSLNYISSKKCDGYYPEDISLSAHPFESEKECLKIFTLYEERKNEMFSLDFDDLLLKTIKILEAFPDVRARWQRRIDHILIDEFQDTNNVQYKLVKLLLKPEASLYVVGDPDQTIYTWRGANQNIILKMEKEFPFLNTVILDRNYRSTQNILDGANKLISHNRERVKKDLYTVKDKGVAISLSQSSSAKEEATWVAREIKKLKSLGQYQYKDMAVLYRSSYITNDFERALMAMKIPYQIYGGLRFYQRKEIKDVLAYFRLVVNQKDDMAFDRIINIPKRGIGDVTIEKIKEEAKRNKQSIFNYINDVDLATCDIKTQAITSLKRMTGLVIEASKKVQEKIEVFSEILKKMITEIGYFDYLAKVDDDDDRLDNVKTLFSDLTSFLKDHPEASFDEYLQNIALLSSQDDMIDGDYLTLMTIHTAKGLEYPVIFVVRLDEGVFPNHKTLDEGYLGIEEERRLCYVAFTRAMEKLYVTYSEGFSPILGGRLIPSRFIEEAGLQVKKTYESKPHEWHFDDDNYSHSSGYFADPPSIKKQSDKPTNYSQDFTKKVNGIEDWEVGDLVEHKNLGFGKVVVVDEEGILEIDFDQHGKKMIMGNHPFLSRVGRKGNKA